MDAGPAMSGMPSGTTPKSSGSFSDSAADCTRSLAARMKRIKPPAIWKSPTEMPSAAKMLLPSSRKPSATSPPVHTAWSAIFWRRSAAMFCPSPRKMAASPIGSIATNSGMKACRNLVSHSLMGARVGKPSAKGN